MSDRASDLLARWNAEKSAYEAWARFIIRTVVASLRDRLQPERAAVFLRLPVEPPRLKGDVSLIQKAFHRGKGYVNAYDEIEDKVGIRFVVLTSDEIRIVGEVITSEASQQHWFYSKDRDYEAERDKNPWMFGYQSDHFVLRSKVGVVSDGITIPPDTPCEVQIRTLLQHAYSELTHDTIYKPSVKTTPEMQRAAAKAMALIEATDDYFRAVGTLIDRAVDSARTLVRELEAEYVHLVGTEPLSKAPLNGELVEFFHELTSHVAPDAVVEWIRSKPFLADRIKSRSATDTIYLLPAILLIYFAVGNFPRAVAADSGPLSADELAPIYSDLGMSAS